VQEYWELAFFRWHTSCQLATTSEKRRSKTESGCGCVRVFGVCRTYWFKIRTWPRVLFLPLGCASLFICCNISCKISPLSSSPRKSRNNSLLPQRKKETGVRSPHFAIPEQTTIAQELNGLECSLHETLVGNQRVCNSSDGNYLFWYIETKNAFQIEERNPLSVFNKNSTLKESLDSD